jgi:hypothetical protein
VYVFIVFRFAPNDAAYEEPVLAKMSVSQLRAEILYHIIPNLIYSNNFPSGNYTTLLASNNLPIVSSM